MIIEKVLEAMPSEAFEPHWYYSFPAVMVVLVLWVFIFAGAATYIRSEPEDEINVKYTTLSLLGIILPIVLIIVQIGMGLDSMDSHSDDKIDWQQDYVEVYLDELPEIKVDVVNKIELKDNNKHATVFFSRDNGVVEEDVKVVLDLDPSEEPHITYRELEEDIGWFEAGYHQHRLHLPKDYQF